MFVVIHDIDGGECVAYGPYATLQEADAYTLKLPQDFNNCVRVLRLIPVPCFELSDAEMDAMTRTADAVLRASRGIDLHVYYAFGQTLVVAAGELDNGDPWKFLGTVPAETILQQWEN